LRSPPTSTLFPYTTLFRSNQGQKLDLALGFSHNIVLDIALEVVVETVSEKGKNPIIKLTSFDKQLLGHVAAKIRSFRKPEPYKGDRKSTRLNSSHVKISYA